MATDVSGTIHIIAEVMGDAKSPTVEPGQGSAVGPDKRISKTAKSLSIMGVQLRKIIKLMTVGGLLKFSQNISNSLNGIFKMVGALVDLFFIPFAPVFVRALDSLYPILGYLALLSVGEKNIGDIWGDLGKWWSNQVEEEGGVWGAIRKLILDVSSVAVLGALLVFADPTGVGWKATKFLTRILFKGAAFTATFILDAFGLRPKTPLRRRNLKAVKARRAISRFAVNVTTLLKSGDFKGLLWRGALTGRAWISKAFGFAINLVPFLGGSKWKTVARLTSKFAAIGTMAGLSFLKFILQTAAGTALKSALVGMGTALVAFIAGLVVIGGTIVGIAWLMNKLFPHDDPDYVQKQIKQSQEVGLARSRDPMEQMPTMVHADADRMAQYELHESNEKESKALQVVINRQIPVVY
jgi:hypothetical protein